MKNWTGVSESGLFEVWGEIEVDDSGFGYQAIAVRRELLVICQTSEEAQKMIVECAVFCSWVGIAVPKAYYDRMRKLEEARYWKRMNEIKSAKS